MSTDINSQLTTSLNSEQKLTLSTGQVARLAYTQQAFDSDDVAGTASYNYANEQNIPLGTAENVQMSDTILSKGLRSQASSFTRMAVNHFFGRCSYNINKLSVHLKILFGTLITFIKEGSNEWSPTIVYESGDVVYFMSTLNNKVCKRTFVCKLDCPSANLPPVYTDGSLINTTYWDEISGRLNSLEVGTDGSSGTTVATINGDLSINGDIYQNGTPYETHAEQLYTKKDTIIMREDATTALSSGTYSGLKVLKYDGTNTLALAVDNTGTARVGDYDPDASTPVDDTQAILTRDEASNLTNGAPFVWDATNKKAISGSFTGSSVITSSSTVINNIALTQNDSIRVLFTSDITGSNTTTALSLTYNGNDIPVKATKNGALVDVYAYELNENNTYVYKYLQAYTQLELMFDGTNFIILGNPIVLSSDDYIIYADGKIGEGNTGDLKSGLWTTAPYGWLLCQGQTLSRTTYANLYQFAVEHNLIETTIGDGKPFGLGDGSTTFTNIDLRGEFLRGAGTNSHTNQGSGGSVGEHQNATLHRADGGFYSGTIRFNDTPDVWAIPNSDKTNYASVGEYFVNTSYQSVSNNPVTYASRPTNTSINYIIKVM